MTSKQIAKKMEEDILNRYGALISVSEFCRYAGVSRDWGRVVLKDCKRFGEGNRTKIFYQDAVEALLKA